METIKIERKQLLEKVQENREAHREVFLAAQQKYREVVIQKLDDRLKSVRDGKAINLAFALPEPVDYTDDYDSAIAALEWDVREYVELGQDEFNELVLNKWRWAKHFAANTSSYLAS